MNPTKYFTTSRRLIALCAHAALLTPALASETTYQQPPKPVADAAFASYTPFGSPNPQGSAILLLTPVIYPPIADLAKPMLRLAGVRIDPTTNGPHHPIYWSKLAFMPVADNKEVAIKLRADAKPGKFIWNAMGTRVAFQNTTDHGIELWVAEATTGQAKKVNNLQLNDVVGTTPYGWTPDQKQLLVRMVKPDRGMPPIAPLAPNGPKIQEATGHAKANSTYEAKDLLKNEVDAQLFEYYATAQIALVDPDAGTVKPLIKPGIFWQVSLSPDARYLLTATIRRPFSYAVTAGRFPMDIEVWNLAGDLLHTIAKLPLADQVPIHGVRTGPQDPVWMPNEDATLTWIEALDGGDWKTKVPFRTGVKRLKAPFQDKPDELFKTEMRLNDRISMQNGQRMWLETEDEDRHWRQQILVDFGQHPAAQKVLWQGSRDDAYGDPGQPDLLVLLNNRRVVRERDGAVLLVGVGSSPDGDRPFVDRFNLSSGQRTRLFRSDKDHFEPFYGWINLDKGTFLTRRESPTEPPNFFVNTLASNEHAPVAAGEVAVDSASKALTHFSDPAPSLRGISKQWVAYKRADGVDLSFMLVLPRGYKKGVRYPTVVHAYPLDYVDEKVAGQVRKSTKTFTTVFGPDEILYALDGYVVLYNAAMPIIGPSMKAYDTYTEQLVASAKAAIDKAVELGVTDPARVGVIGHSHGALMTANLLARSSLFKAGVARSGAYNKTLTSFGFQNERRTLWEAQKTYLDVSPLFFADKIKVPLLLIHGELDQNPGTVPMQSERMFEAIRGVGGTARLVMLPFEAHGYQARESVQHVLYEMMSWFERYVKNTPPAVEKVQ